MKVMSYLTHCSVVVDANQYIFCLQEPGILSFPSTIQKSQYPLNLQEPGILPFPRPIHDVNILCLLIFLIQAYNF